MRSCPYSTDCAGCVTLGNPLLRIEALNLVYNGNPILKDLDAEVRDVQRRCHIQGQIIGILGPSGVGKTQLFRIVAGLNRPTSGRVLINHNEPTAPGKVGVVAQNYTLFEHRRILPNLMLGATRKYPNPKTAEAACMEMLTRFNLQDKAQVYPAVLSGGQRQRVAIIQQLLCSEHFILLDEPFSGLDPINVDKVGALLTEVSCLDELNTLIITSHDVTAICAIADHLWLLGRDRDSAGNVIPGACIQKVYNLVDLGLCWQENIQTRPDFVDFVREVKERFRTL